MPKTIAWLTGSGIFHGSVNFDSNTDDLVDGVKLPAYPTFSDTPPGQTDVPPVVDEVDNQISFKMFDGGWILPETQRRGGRLPLERRIIPLPDKRIRGWYLLSIFFANILIC